MSPAERDRPPPQPAPAERPEFFVTKDRAKRIAFRLVGIAKERSLFYAGERVGMTSFAESVPALLEVEADLQSTIDAVLRGRLRDRERGETEIPLVVALESALERVARARGIEERRRASRIDVSWAQRKLLGLLADASQRLDAFVRLYDDRRIVPLPAAVDLTHVLLRVEDDAVCDRLPSTATEPPGLRARPVDRMAPTLTSCADALEDLLRAARAEVPAAAPPWRLERASPTAPIELSIGERTATKDDAVDATEDDAELPSPFASDLREERTARARAVLRFAHDVLVERTKGKDGETVGLHLTLADRVAEAVGARVRPDVALAPAIDGAVRAYLSAAAKFPDTTAPERMIGAMGVFRAIDAELARVISPSLSDPGARLAAQRIPRESSRKAPVRREVIATLEEAIPGFPGHRVGDVLDAIAAGKPERDTVKPPDVAVVLALLGRRWPKAAGFGERVLPLGALTDADVTSMVVDVVELAAVRSALDRGRDPGPGWDARFEAAAFRLLGRFAILPA